MRICRVVALLAGLASGFSTPALAQEATRRGLIEQDQAEKVKTLHPYPVTNGERIANKFEDITVNGGLHWHPFFDSAYRGGGFTLGVGYMHHVSSYDLIDVRGSYTIKGYKRAEVEFMAPRLLQRRGSLSIIGGWREATQVGYFGTGTNTSVDDRVNYGFEELYGSATMTVRPTRRFLTLSGGVERTKWTQQSGQGSDPSIETAYTPATLPGLGSDLSYLHSQGTVGFDWRPEENYARRGGLYGVTFHDYKDSDEEFGFQQVDYEIVQHFPILRETWAISLHGLAQTTFLKDEQEIPYHMLPSLGGGSNLRGYSSWRFRDRNSLLLQGEWRIMVNRYLDTAVFYDTGKVTERTEDLNLSGLKHDYGFGVRFHSLIATLIRVELAKSSEGLVLVFSSSAVF